jgi:hypothetical protein
MAFDEAEHHQPHDARLAGVDFFDAGVLPRSQFLECHG